MPKFRNLNAWLTLALVSGFVCFAGHNAYGTEPPSASFSNGSVRLTVHGLIDLRAVYTDNEVGFFDGGQGKARFGGSRDDGARITGGIGEISPIVRGQFGSETQTHLHLKHDKDQKVVVDVVEGYVRYRPVSTSEWRINAKLGAFFPPVSMENTDVAWQSSYTVTWSAINSWIGEDVRALGGELSTEYRYEGGHIAFGGSLFGGNDPAGTILSKRGWALHDRASTLFDSLPMPTESSEQAQLDEIDIFTEIDDRPGYYLFARTSDLDTGTDYLLTFYHNNADPAATRNGQDAWRTWFLAAGTRHELPVPEALRSTFVVDLVSQAMTGATEREHGPGQSGTTDVRFHSFFLMLSAEFGKKLPQSLALRWDGFQTADRLPLEGGPLV